MGASKTAGLVVEKIVSNGETGAGRGGLEASFELELKHDGVCAKGRKAEDGDIPEKFVLRECPSEDFEQAAEANVKAGCVTLVLTFGRLTGSSRMVAEIAKRHKKQWMHLDLNAEATNYAVKVVREFLVNNQVKVVHVAGAPESASAGLQAAVKDLFMRVFRPEISRIYG